jgi:tRNA threonylcarbamoyladenosine biosynthesis protein TsaE
VKLRIRSRAPEQTERVGNAVGRAAEAGLLVTLQGPLGAGKTLFTQGIARGLAVARPQYVSSPTFTIYKRYEGRLLLHHIDLFRLPAGADLEDVGLDEALFGSGVCVIEWPDLFLDRIPTDRLAVRFQLAQHDHRVLEFEAFGPRSTNVLDRLTEVLGGQVEREETNDL